MATRNVTGAWRSFDASGPRTPRAGTITFKPSVLVRDSNTNEIVVQDPVVVDLDSEGRISVQLQVTDDPNLNPVGWFWVVTEQITGLTARRYQMLLPASGDSFDLSEIEFPYSAVPIDPTEIYIRGFEADHTVVNPDVLPSIDSQVVNSVAEVTFNLPRAADVSVGTVNELDPDATPIVTATVTDGDVALNFGLPGAAEFTVTDTTVTPATEPSVSATVTDGDVALDFSLPRAADVAVGTTTVVNPDQSPSASSSADTDGDVTVDFELPRAPTFTVGTVTPGVDETDADVTDTGTDGDIVLDFTVPRGLAATADLGDVTVVNPDQLPDVRNSGTTTDAIFDFDLPRAPDFTVGTVTTLAPGSSATVTDVGVDGDIELDFELPKGQDGDGTAYYGQMSTQTSQLVTIPAVDTYVDMAVSGTFDTANSFGLVAPTTASFGVKNDSGATQLLTVVATADVEVGNNRKIGFRLAKNGVAITETTCSASTGTFNFAKLMTQWFVEVDQGDEISLLIANLTNGANITVNRSKIIAFTAGRQGEDGADGAPGEPGVVAATDPIAYDSGTQTVSWVGDTDDVPEGSNLYHTTQRAADAAPVQSVNSQTGAVSLSTTNIGEGTNLYYTDARVDARTATNRAPLYFVENVRTSSYTLALSDVSKVVAFNSSSSRTLTVPTNTSVAFPIGTVINVYRAGTGAVTISGASGVTVRNAGTIPAQFGERSLRKRDTNEWVLV